MKAETVDKKLKIATRGSQLALWQANYVADQLRRKGHETELNIIKTTGDRVQDRFLHEIGGKGLFVRELEQAMLDGKADFAVHSLKDLPAITPSPFELAAILHRHDHRDAMIFRADSPFAKLFSHQSTITREQARRLNGAKIASSSLRRQSLLKGLDSQIELVAVRGNVDTRIRKLSDHQWDALILAAASLERLQLQGLHYCYLDPTWFTPCAAQGALALECHEDAPCKSDLSALRDPVTQACASLERSILAALGGDCTMPFGCLVQPNDGGTSIDTLVLDYQGSECRYTWNHPQAPTQLNTEEATKKTLSGLQNEGLASILKALQEGSADLGAIQ